MRIKPVKTKNGTLLLAVKLFKSSLLKLARVCRALKYAFATY